MVSILAHHLQALQAIATLLEKRGILTKDDLAALIAQTPRSRQATEALIDRAESIYRGLAIPLGVSVPTRIF